METPGLSSLVDRWVPKLLTAEQKKTRKDVCKDLRQRYISQSFKTLGRILVTADESWFHYYEPELKSQSSVWIAKGSGLPIKARAVQSAGKRMASVFWDEEGILLIDWLPEKETINSDYYIGY